MNIIKCAQKVSGIDKIYAVIGGFHISSTNEGMKVAEFLRQLGVKLVSPCHYTHAKAKIGIIKIMEEEYIRNGSGKSISIGFSESSWKNKTQ
jgi:7,8-dihydropterin-6-yl-methyl-4-(beta-D-ribofuranosyl)aminobenzene 5'-phosphate synthase